MDKNYSIHQGVLNLYNAAMHFEKIDKKFAVYLLAKSKEYLEKIVVDEKIISEINEYAKKIVIKEKIINEFDKCKKN